LEQEERASRAAHMNTRDNLFMGNLFELFEAINIQY
jgi:hypothetical protein